MQGYDGIELVSSFIVVAEELSFRRSAERLNIDQSALTRRIQKLEHNLQFPLFERTTREVSLTPAGRVFYDESIKLLEAYEQSIESARRVAAGRSGELRIGYTSFAATKLVPQAIVRFRRVHPYVTVTLKYVSTQMQKIALARNEIDLGYMLGPFTHTDFNSITLTSDPLYVVTPRNHRLARMHEVRPADLAGEDFILGNMTGWDAYRWRLTELFSSEGVSLKPTLEASNTLGLLGLVAVGLGVTIYPESLVGVLGRNVEARPIMHPSFRIETNLVWRRNNRTKAVRMFAEIAKNLPVS